MNESAESMAGGEDPVVCEFLDFLTRDMKRHPARLQASRLEPVISPLIWTGVFRQKTTENSLCL